MAGVLKGKFQIYPNDPAEWGGGKIQSLLLE